MYAAGGTPCVAAHSTTRALYASYNGPLYRVRRASDNATPGHRGGERGRRRQRRHAGFVLRRYDLPHHHH
ncbi:arabinofuranosidase catalytic domain-containing protein [Nonomuraea sp. NPDC046802]|uniref:arabinofuranosidase catalytic domain-containing protein n=1 Tax=Nonomuraea sp. NPDC046802 TaxID=3154919 RepID=UPI00340DDF9E